MIRTRFAPSPTGYLHIGGARTALFCWAYAKKHGGAFILRIEDTDRERSTLESEQAIFDAMKWLGLDYEGPYFQMDRLDRYREVAEQLIRNGKAYYCYATKEELEALRGAQRAKGEKPRYDGRWRPESAQRAGLKAPPGAKPVVRFRNPDAGEVSFADLVKGGITVANGELDDLVLLRADGIPTYNFGVVVDDIDMAITHVIRGDDHVNNTPRQINIYRALGAVLQKFAHVPLILGADGERLSKRHGAVSVMQYRDDGYLPEALVNYLARLGWSHGDEEMFSREQLVEWFDLEHISASAARFNPEKLTWLNQEYIKKASDQRLARLVSPILESMSLTMGSGPELEKVVALFKDRATTLNHLAEAATMFYRYEEPSTQAVSQCLNERNLPVVEMYVSELAKNASWDRSSLSATADSVLQKTGFKMRDLAMPVRIMVMGKKETPPLDAVLYVMGRDNVLRRLEKHLQPFRK